MKRLGLTIILVMVCGLVNAGPPFTPSQKRLIDLWIAEAVEDKVTNPATSNWNVATYSITNIDNIITLEGVTLNKPPSFRAVAATNQAVASATATKLTAGTEISDIGGGYDPVLFRYTPPKNGRYVSFSNIRGISFIDDKYIQLALYTNGVANLPSVGRNFVSTATSNSITARAFNILDLTTNDYVDVYILHNYGAARSLHAPYTVFSMSWIGE